MAIFRALLFEPVEQCVGRGIGDITSVDTTGNDSNSYKMLRQVTKMKPEPVVATWELWNVAKMLITVRGDGAEAHAAAKLADARARQHEGDEIVWQGVITQLARIRAGEPLA